MNDDNKCEEILNEAQKIHAERMFKQLQEQHTEIVFDQIAKTESLNDRVRRLDREGHSPEEIADMLIEEKNQETKKIKRF